MLLLAVTALYAITINRDGFNLAFKPGMIADVEFGP